MTRVMERIKSQTGWDKLRNEIRTTEIIRGASPVESWGAVLDLRLRPLVATAVCCLLLPYPWRRRGGAPPGSPFQGRISWSGSRNWAALFASDGPQWTSCSVQACFDANTPRICTSAVVAIGQGHEVQSGSYQSCFNGFLLSLPATSSPCRHQLPPKVGVAVGKINLYELTSYLAHGTLNFWRNPQFQSPTLNLAVSFYFLWQVLTAYFSSPSVRVFLTTICNTRIFKLGA